MNLYLEKNVYCVLISYNPNEKLLNKCIESISSEVRTIYIVDNGSNNFEFDKKIDNIKFIKLQENMGISYAQNIGIKEAMKDNADYILLSDQDTVYPKDYINNMIKTFSFDDKICAITPLFKDAHGKKINDGFYKKSFWFAKQFFPDSGYHEVFQTIASGKILKTEYLTNIGLMDENLFIDWVDYEWCWRARQKGYKIIGNAEVAIEHQLGDSSKDIGFREVNLRSPIRHYYITRNAFYLAIRDKSLNSVHKITLFFKSFRYIIGYPLLSKPRLTHLKYVLLGFWHGIIGKLGKLK